SPATCAADKRAAICLAISFLAIPEMESMLSRPYRSRFSTRETAAFQLRAHQGLHRVGNRCPSHQFGQLANSQVRHFQTMKISDRLENKLVQARRAVANAAAQKALDGLPFQDELAQLERYDKLIKLLPSSDRRNLGAASIIGGLCVFFAGLAWA